MIRVMVSGTLYGAGVWGSMEQKTGVSTGKR